MDGIDFDAIGAPPLAAPFPYFGGKKSAAAIIWQALGDVPSYVEPFAGSSAVLLQRPPEHRPWRESINDIDGFVSNFWRAISRDPDGVADYACYPVIERDLEARHYWLITEGKTRLAELSGEPDGYDVKIAGWWVWGACAWIGSGWCSGTGPWTWSGEAWCSRKLPHLGDAGRGINRQLPHLGDAGRGINRQLPHLGNVGRGINRQLPHLGDAGRGINRQLPHLGDAGQDGAVLEWFCALSARLRRVVVCSGDWRRVVASPTVLGLQKEARSVGVFFDPPYGGGRTANLYSHDADGVAAAVGDWCFEHGADLRKRIVLAGYAGEGHERLIDVGWRVIDSVPKQRGAGYGNTTAGGVANYRRERLWLSPGCLTDKSSTK